MKYMFLIFADESRRLTSEERQTLAERHCAVVRDASSRGILVAAEPMKPTRFATTVRKQSGQPVVSDGPYAESKEQMSGYYILDLDTLDEAIEWASRIPAGPLGAEGGVEIRLLPGVARAN